MEQAQTRTEIAQQERAEHEDYISSGKHWPGRLGCWGKFGSAGGGAGN
jgi:hypothetical protein